MLEPPDIARRFESDDERAEAIVRLADLDRRIQAWHKVSADSGDALPTQVRELLLRRPMPPGETPELRLNRWMMIFNDDIDTVHDARARVIHGVRVPDVDLRGAVWLAQHLIDLLEGPDPDVR